jgi:hypothetical protein
MANERITEMLRDIDKLDADLLHDLNKFPYENMWGKPEFEANRGAARSIQADRRWLARFRANYLEFERMGNFHV